MQKIGGMLYKPSRDCKQAFLRVLKLCRITTVHTILPVEQRNKPILNYLIGSLPVNCLLTAIILSMDSCTQFSLTLASERYTIYFDIGRKPGHGCT